jgi:hypothetical protein
MKSSALWGFLCASRFSFLRKSPTIQRSTVLTFPDDDTLTKDLTGYVNQFLYQISLTLVFHRVAVEAYSPSH